MNVHWSAIVLALALLLNAYLPLLRGRSDPFQHARDRSAREGAHAFGALKEHTKEWAHPESGEMEPFVMEVEEGVYVAIGFGIANSILLLSPPSHPTPEYVIIDTLESLQTATNARNAFAPYVEGRELAAIIYTHNHQDHCFGADVFLHDRPLASPVAVLRDGRVVGAKPPLQEEGGVAIWSHASTREFMDRAISLTGMVEFRRAMRQFGTLLSPRDSVNSGIGPFLGLEPNDVPGVIRPTHTFEGSSHVIHVAGLRLELHHAPGETDDQIVVWDAEREILFAADNIYRAFPNLYPIRGSPARNVLKWGVSVDQMRSFGARVLVPSHTRPLVGKAVIEETLLAYADAIRFVHDQTVRFMDLGLNTEQIVQLVQLPAKLRHHPFLQEFYGTVEWSVKGVLGYYLGWFGGDPVDLFPLHRSERAARLAALGGGPTRVLSLMEEALAEKHYQWVLEVATAMESLYGPEESRWRELMVEAMRSLATEQTSANAHNYYLTYANEVEQQLNIKPSVVQLHAMMMKLDPADIFSVIPTTLVAETADGVDECVMWYMSNTQECHTIELRNQVARTYASDNPSCYADSTCHVKVTTEVDVLRGIVSKQRSAAMAIASGALTVEGGHIAFASFMAHFKSAMDYD